jgi:uncharacterized membrane protein YfcA
MDPLEALVIFSAAALAGAMNAVAGGGTLATFPTAMAFGLSARVASATSTLALAPGAFAAAWTYRKHLTRQRRLALWLVFAGGTGGLLGAVLLDRGGDASFDSVVPWLVLAATAAIGGKGLLSRWLAKRAVTEGVGNGKLPNQRHPGLIATAVLLLSVYGGYFGAGASIVLLSVLSLWGLELLEANAIKTLVIGFINLLAAAYFLASGLGDLEVAAIMAVGAVVGGTVGARFAQRVSPGVARAAVVTIGVTVSAVLAYGRLSA